MVHYNIWQPQRGKVGGLRFALEDDKVERFETSKVAPLTSSASFRYSSSLVLNLMIY